MNNPIEKIKETKNGLVLGAGVLTILGLIALPLIMMKEDTTQPHISTQPIQSEPELNHIPVTPYEPHNIPPQPYIRGFEPKTPDFTDINPMVRLCIENLRNLSNVTPDDLQDCYDLNPKKQQCFLGFCRNQDTSVSEPLETQIIAPKPQRTEVVSYEFELNNAHLTEFTKLLIIGSIVVFVFSRVSR